MPPTTKEEMKDIIAKFEKINKSLKVENKINIESIIKDIEEADKIIYHYKCRVDAFFDICEFMIWVSEKNKENEIKVRLINSQIKSLKYFIEWEFESNLNHKEMIDLMKEADDEINDLHIMYQTLTYFEDYTGERVW